jgi:hypothetical protein
VLIPLLALLFAVQSSAVQQQSADRRTWYQAYADAQRAIDVRNWEKAIADLDAAERRGAPKPGRNVFFYGDLYRDYNPDYYRGVAYTNLGRLAEAASAFDRVEKAELIRDGDPLSRQFAQQRTLVRNELRKQEPAATQTVRNEQRVVETNANAAAANAPAVNVQRPAQNQAQSAAPDAPQNVAANAAQINRPQQDPKPPPVQQTAAPVRRPPANARATPAIARTANAKAPVAPPPSAPMDDRVGIVQYFSGDYEAAAASLTALTSNLSAQGASDTSIAVRRERAYFYLACAQAALVLTGRAPRRAIGDARAQLTRANDTGQFSADKQLISPRIRQELGMRP